MSKDKEETREQNK
jgi:hypothetical protein